MWIDKIVEAARQYYQETDNDPNSRFRSWEHCYLVFHKARMNGDVNYDLLSLHLAFYLASWGMLRGSSGLLQKDYRVHIPVVEMIMEDVYNDLFGNSCNGVSCYELIQNDTLSKLEQLRRRMRNHYREHGVNLTDTLFTKILLGTFGCVPAYDDFLRKAVKQCEIIVRQVIPYNRQTITTLANYYIEHEDAFENVRNQCLIHDSSEGIIYPPMKVLDMGLWRIGYKLDLAEKARKKASRALANAERAHV